VGWVSNPTYDDGRDPVFAALTGGRVNGSGAGTMAEGLPAYDGHPAVLVAALAEWNPTLNISTHGGQTSQPVFAGALAKEDDYLLLEMPVFPEPNKDVQSDGAKPDESHGAPAEPRPEFIMGGSAFVIAETGGAN
jgi:hypothetical protein